MPCPPASLFSTFRIFTALFCLITYVSVAQNVPPTSLSFSCGSDDYMKHRMETDSVYRKFVLNAKAVQPSNKAADNTLLTIPVVFIVYHLGEPVGQGSNVSDADLQAQIDLMNRLYGASTSIYQDGGTDSRIRFVMAKRGPECTPINGAVRIDAQSVSGYRTIGVGRYNYDIQEKLYDLAGPSINQMGQQAVIVRVYWKVIDAGAWAGFGGGISIGATTLKYNGPYNSVLSHEMGHVLWLYHTFEGDSFDANGCPVNTNPSQNGDQVADTDPHRFSDPIDGCAISSESQINDCTGRPFGKIGRNIMSYGCNRSVFTPGQIARMRSYLAGSLSRFVNSPYAFPPLASEAPKAPFCLPGSGISSISSNEEGISGVRLGEIDSRTSYNGIKPLLYQDLTCAKSTVVQAGQSYTISIDAPNNNRYRRVYLDWNNDGVFDETTERVFNTTIGEEKGTIRIPTNSSTGQALRMRVVVCDGEQEPTACFVPSLGAAQDFSVWVESINTSKQVKLGQLNTFSYCAGQSVLLPYQLTKGENVNVVQISAELSDANGSFNTPLLLSTRT